MDFLLRMYLTCSVEYDILPPYPTVSKSGVIKAYNTYMLGLILGVRIHIRVS